MGKSVRAWMRVNAVGGDYPLPTSEAAYLANKLLIDEVIPYGATLAADGTWIQDDCINNSFPQALPGWARAAGQRYVPFLDPGHGQTEITEAVLDNQAVWQDTADDAVILATTRFDAPWDGVMYDAVDLTGAYIAKQQDFMVVLADTVHAAGLPFEVAYRGVRVQDEGFSLSLDTILSVADSFDYYIYGWWELPHSLGPYHWAVASIENAMAHGLDLNTVYLGIPIFSRYWPDLAVSTSHNITHTQAVTLATVAGERIHWVECGAKGLVRENYANIGTGQVWIHDNETVKARLSLIDEFNLAGAMLFIPGTGNESVWRAIAEWKKLPEPTTPYLYNTGAIFGGWP